MKNKFLQIYHNTYFLGALNVFIGILTGAFGAHGAKNVLTQDLLNTFKTGSTYQVYHGIGLILLGNLKSQFQDKQEILPIPFIFLLGILLFSGNCYLYSFTKIKALAMIVPLGGLCFLIGWLWLALAFYKK